MGVSTRAGRSAGGGAPGAAKAIVGGNIVTPPEEAPWSVLVSARNAEGATLCSGSIIAPDRVLTTAHCVFDGGAQRAPAALADRPLPHLQGPPGERHR